MIINRNFKDFKFRHRSKKNQIIYTSKRVNNDNEVLNLIDNFLLEKNSFIFESVEKGKIKGRYTIFGKNPDKIWEFNKNSSFLITNKKKIKLKQKPAKLIEDIIENFKFKIPAGLPPISSLISGYFSSIVDICLGAIGARLSSGLLSFIIPIEFIFLVINYF